MHTICHIVYDILWSPYLGAPAWSAPHLWPSELKGNVQKQFQINKFKQSIIDPVPGFILSTCRNVLGSTHSRTRLNTILCPGSQTSRPKSQGATKFRAWSHLQVSSWQACQDFTTLGNFDISSKQQQQYSHRNSSSPWMASASFCFLSFSNTRLYLSFSVVSLLQCSCCGVCAYCALAADSARVSPLFATATAAGTRRPQLTWRVNNNLGNK